MSTTSTQTRSNTTFALPGTPRYDEAVGTYNLSAELRPVAAMVAVDREQVLGAVREAVHEGYQLIPLSTGHAASMVSKESEGGHLVRVALDEPVCVDREAGTINIPAGATWGAVSAVAQRHGFAVPHGSSPTVGAVGYLLGGGLSFYGRLRGVAANHIASITIATSDGSVTAVDEDNDPDLFWALRGGGGGFGVVLSVVLEMFPMWKVITGSIAWDAADAADIAVAWRTWTEQAPRDVTTSLRLLNLPDIPTTPEPLRGRQVIMVDGAITVPTDASLGNALDIQRELLDPLRTVADPLVDTWHLGPPTDLLTTHADPPDPLPYVTDTFTLQGVTEAVIRRWVDSAGPGSGSQLVVAELRQLGGAFAERDPSGGAFSHLEGDLVSFNLGVLFAPGAADQARVDQGRIRAAVAPSITEFTPPTMVENPTTPRRTFPLDVEDTVEAVRSRVDPSAVFGLDAHRSR